MPPIGAGDDSILAEWKATPSEIEEVERPWSMGSAGKDHNRELTERAYPAAVAFDAGKSFSDAVVSLLNNQQLVTALEELA